MVLTTNIHEKINDRSCFFFHGSWSLEFQYTFLLSRKSVIFPGLPCRTADVLGLECPFITLNTSCRPSTCFWQAEWPFSQAQWGSWVQLITRAEEAQHVQKQQLTLCRCWRESHLEGVSLITCYWKCPLTQRFAKPDNENNKWKKQHLFNFVQFKLSRGEKSKWERNKTDILIVCQNRNLPEQFFFGNVWGYVTSFS